MSDLVDYLRDKLEHAEDVVCTCPEIDLSRLGDPPDQRRLARGLDPRCPIHGGRMVHTHFLYGPERHAGGCRACEVEGGR